MNHHFIEKWTEMAKGMQKPLQEMIELNLKTMRNISYIKPEELVGIRKPEELFEKHVALAIENGHKTLDYLQKIFEITEKSLLAFSSTVKESAASSSANMMNTGVDISSSMFNPINYQKEVAKATEEAFNTLQKATRAVTPQVMEGLKPSFDHSIGMAQDLSKTKPLGSKVTKKQSDGRKGTHN